MSNPTHTLVFTDLDGTLLDHHDYSWEPARPAINRIRELSIPLVLCSSKTAAEMLCLHNELDLTSPFIVENGGGIYGFSETGPVSCSSTDLNDYSVLRLGEPYSVLRAFLQDSAERHGLDIQYFDQQTAEELAMAVGLSTEEAQRALIREFDVPFRVDPATAEPLVRDCAEAGFTLTTGGRFWHLMGGTDKGRAVVRVVEAFSRRWGRVHTIALGDSSNDLPMLKVVDQPVLIPNPASSSPIKNFPANTFRPSLPGPAGWCQALEKLLPD